MGRWKHHMGWTASCRQVSAVALALVGLEVLRCASWQLCNTLRQCMQLSLRFVRLCSMCWRV